MDKTVQIIVSGRVQGVGFRWATKQVADQLGNRISHQFNGWSRENYCAGYHRLLTDT
ncbi:MAG: Hypothetical protein AJITA_01068 [Acetilactobacillus jinshanensis]